ncbi:hypothetical protein R1sor_016370 [Riccia sorocarpa]|uniref:Uncharacterized protein n=1 Tax=Riccia sorocarpa TaxID=122646 RepID=A0ABD3HGN0_9MARC
MVRQQGPFASVFASASERFASGGEPASLATWLAARVRFHWRNPSEILHPSSLIRDLNLPWYTEEYLFDADAQPPFPGSAELDAGPGDQGPDETQNSPARSDADNSPESEEEPVPIPENGLPGWIAVGVQYNPSDLRKYFLCDGKTWDSGKLNIEHHCSHPVLKQNWKKWMRAANPSWNGKHTQVRKCFVFFCGLELHGIKIDWSTVNASKAINRYSMIEKEKARKAMAHAS